MFYEYRVVVLIGTDHIQANLNKMAAEGWRLASAASVPEVYEFVLTFERPVP